MTVLLMWFLNSLDFLAEYIYYLRSRWVAATEKNKKVLFSRLLKARDIGTNKPKNCSMQHIAQ
jgi:hypothetical protein